MTLSRGRTLAAVGSTLPGGPGAAAGGSGRCSHPVYSFGLTRCSFSFCIFASRSDLRRALELRPDLYAKYAQLEGLIAHTLSPTQKYLPELTGIPVKSADRTLLRTRGPKESPAARRRAASVSS